MIYSSGRWHIDTARFELVRESRPVAVRPQVLDLLILLIENRERIVSKSEILNSIWKGRVVSEAALSSCIKAARQAIGDDGSLQQCIRTVHGRGFRFIAAIAIAKDGEDTSAPPADTLDGAGLASVSVPQEATKLPGPSLSAPHLPRPDKPSLVVLPFTNLSGTAETDRLTDALTEDVITDLSRNGWLFVIGRNSSFAYRGRELPSRTVSAELGVRYIVEGSVRKTGDRVRVAAQLVDADTGMQEWGHRYDRPLSDLFEVLDEITRAIVASLGSELRRAEGKRARRADPATLDAWGLLHRGMAISWSTFNARTNAEAEELYRRAMEIAPEDPRAHAFLATCLAMKATNGWSLDVRAIRKEAWVEAQRALDSAPDDPVVLGQIGHLNSCLNHPDVGLRLLERSIELDPNNAFSIGMRAYALTALGRAEEAIAAVEEVRRRSPRDPSVHWYLAMLAWANLQLERFDDCARAAKESVAHYNGWQPPWVTLAVALVALGDLEAARAAAATGRRIAPTVPRWGYEEFFRYHSRDAEQADRVGALLREAWEG